MHRSSSLIITAPVPVSELPAIAIPYVADTSPASGPSESTRPEVTSSMQLSGQMSLHMPHSMHSLPVSSPDGLNSVFSQQ